MDLQVLLVEDESSDMEAYCRDFPPIFQEFDVQVTIHPAATFEDAALLVKDRSRRFDLVLSDVYRGELSKGDAAVIDMVNVYRGTRFCPLIIFSASARPEELKLGAFVMWAEKAEAGGIEKAIRRMLTTGIPQIARHLHDELDRMAGSYLWEFLERNWDKLKQGDHVNEDILRRLIRRRAALQLAEIDFTEAGAQPVSDVHGPEFYVYPPIHATQFSLGQVIRKKTDHGEIRIVLTPHCYLTVQHGQSVPRAEFVLTVKTVPVRNILGVKLDNAKNLDVPQRDKRLRTWATPPSGQDVGRPEGRYWYLPHFLDIPHLYCDLLQVESISYGSLQGDYESLAVLSPPYAESLQACYGAFHGSVGIPNIRPASIAGMLG